jgi:acetate kinase
VIVLVVPADEERMMAREALRTLSRYSITRSLATQAQQLFVMEVRTHHVHLTQQDVESLFGKGHQLTRATELSQPGQYVCAEQVTLAGPKGRLEKVSVFGPPREFSQVEIGMTGQFALGVHPPTRESGDIADTPGCVIEGPSGRVTLDRGVISPWRHLHMKPEDALRYGVRNRAVVAVRIKGNGETTLKDVLIDVDANARLTMHLDADEAKTANLQSGALGYITEIQNQG